MVEKLTAAYQALETLGRCVLRGAGRRARPQRRPISGPMVSMEPSRKSEKLSRRHPARLNQDNMEHASRKGRWADGPARSHRHRHGPGSRGRPRALDGLGKPCALDPATSPGRDGVGRGPLPAETLTDQAVPVVSRDELGQLAEEFNAMALATAHCTGRRTMPVCCGPSVPARPRLLVSRSGAGRRSRRAGRNGQPCSPVPFRRGGSAPGHAQPGGLPWQPPEELAQPLQAALLDQQPYAPLI